MLGDREPMVIIMHIDVMCDMVKFGKTTKKVSSCMKHVLQLCNAPQLETSIDGTAVASTAINKSMNNSFKCSTG